MLDARLVLGPTDAGRDGHDVFGPKNFGGHALIINALGFPHRFLCQTTGGKKLHRESPDEHLLPFHLPAVCLEVGVDGGNAGTYAFVLREEKNIGVVSGERLEIVNRRQRAAERPFFNQPRCY